MSDPIANATGGQLLFAPVARATVSVMQQDLYKWRRERLAALAKLRGGNAALGRDLGYKDGAFVSQMIRGHRPITEKTVAQAERLSGAANWFLAPLSFPEGPMDATPLPHPAQPSNVQPVAGGEAPTLDIRHTIDHLGVLLLGADDRTRAAVAELLLRYAQNPADGERLAQAIEVLMQGTKKP